MKYDYLIVGAGLFGATLADVLTRNYGKSVLVVERKPYVGGMCHTYKEQGITVHEFGAHIFRTDNKDIWEYLNDLVPFKPFVNSPLAYCQGKIYNLPFNMNTYNQLWGIIIPEDAENKIDKDCVYYSAPKNLEEYALSKVGKTIYYKFIKEYTEKQWGKKCAELPASILGRLPLRFTYDNNYYTDKPYQGIPVTGYTELIDKMLEHSSVLLGIRDWREYEETARQIIYTGSIDEYYGYALGKLDYRSLRFETYVLDKPTLQGNAVVNYTTYEFPQTRRIEHKHFLNEESPVTIISYEYPEKYNGTNERYYPIETDDNLMLYHKYALIKNDVIFAGRLGSYKYTDMEQTVKLAMHLAFELCESKGGKQ